MIYTSCTLSSRAEVAEQADAHDSNSCSFGSVGSIPTFGTNRSFGSGFLLRAGTCGRSRHRNGFMRMFKDLQTTVFRLVPFLYTLPRLVGGLPTQCRHRR